LAKLQNDGLNPPWIYQHSKALLLVVEKRMRMIINSLYYFIIYIK